MFSPAWFPRPHERSACGPVVCVREPCAAMRLALLTATVERQLLHDNAARPCAARSLLINDCCVLRTTMEGAATRGGAEPPPEAAGGLGAAVGLVFGGGSTWGGSGSLGGSDPPTRAAVCWRAPV